MTRATETRPWREQPLGRSTASNIRRGSDVRGESADYVRLLAEEGMNFTQAAHAVGALETQRHRPPPWPQGRGRRATGRNEKPLVDCIVPPWTNPDPFFRRSPRARRGQRTSSRPSASGRFESRLRPPVGRDPGTVSREVERNRNPESGGSEPYRAQQKAADRLKRPKRAGGRGHATVGREDRRRVAQALEPEQIANRWAGSFRILGIARDRRDDIRRPSTLAGQGRLKQRAETRHEAGANRRRPKRPMPQTRFRETHGMISERPPEIAGPGGPGHWEGQSNLRAASKAPSARSSSAPTKVHDPAVTARRARRRTRQQAIIDKMLHLPNSCATSLDLGPGSGTRPAQTDRRLAGHGPSTSATRTPGGSAAPTRTPNGSCASTSPKAPTYPSTRRDYLDAVARNSTTHAKPTGS